MGVHVNMMDDALIATLPAEYLRSALRALVHNGSEAQRTFTQHIRTQLQAKIHDEMPSPKSLFPGTDEVSNECLEYVAFTKCLFASKLVTPAINYITHFVQSVETAQVSWTQGSELHKILDKFSGDIVQAMQALKETAPKADDALQNLLQTLLSSFASCEQYCASKNLEDPFKRASRQVKDSTAFYFPNLTTHAAGGGALKELTAANSNVEMFAMGARSAPRLFNGLWQLASSEWGYSSADKQQAALTELAQAGFTAADMADHYGDAELVYGDFRASLAPDSRDKVYAATKWCIFRDIGQPVTREYVLAAVKERSRRLRGRVDLLQFHWHNYEAKEYLDILLHLVSITKSNPELVAAIGLCNFDADHTEEACEYLLEATGEVGIVSNQVQFSVLDSRPLKKVTQVSEKYNLKLLTYGSFCGGLLAEKWLGAPVPDAYSASNPLTPSQRKYLDTLYAWGTWDEFQVLLGKLAEVAAKQGAGVTIANVATRWVLQQPAVGAILVGTRLGVTSHGTDNLGVFGWKLEGEDLQAINDLALGKDGAKTTALFEKFGDCGDEYRQ